MPDQATHLRQLIRDAAAQHAHDAPQALTVVVSGARPGAGVTTLVAELGRELTRLGQRVALVDANVARPRLAAEFGLRPRTTLAELLAGSRSAAEAFARTADGMLLLAGARESDAVTLSGPACERLAAELAVVSRQAAVILIDAGAGINPWIDRLWRLAGQLLVVAEPDPAAMLDAYAAVKQSQFHRLDRRVRLVVNRDDRHPNAADLDRRFADTCRRFLFIDPRPAVWLPERSLAAGHDGHAHDHAADDDPFARALRLLAADLACEARSAGPPRPQRHSDSRRSARSSGPNPRPQLAMAS